jgi:hypothetical protein
MTPFDSLPSDASEPAGLPSSRPVSRRQWLRAAAVGAGALAALPLPLFGCSPAPRREAGAPADERVAAAEGYATEPPSEEDLRRLAEWIDAVRSAGLHRADVPPGRTAAAVGEQALGTPYEAFTLEEYLRAGGSPSRTEPLTLSLTRFDCVTLVESCLALGTLARTGQPVAWNDYAREMERLRYRGGVRAGYLSRLHYFSEWIADNARRGRLRDLGQELGGTADTRPLRFMSQNREAYPALAEPEVFEALREHERAADGHTRWVIPTARIPQVADRIRTGDVLAFATAIEGLDVTHSAFAYRDADDVVRVLHAPLSGGVVEITRSTLQQYVQAIRRSTGILVARPLG